jgi:hypothetical protein
MHSLLRLCGFAPLREEICQKALQLRLTSLFSARSRAFLPRRYLNVGIRTEQIGLAFRELVL